MSFYYKHIIATPFQYKKKVLPAVCCLILLFTLSSCFKEEDALPKPIYNGTVNTVIIPLTSEYSKQFYFDLFTNSIIKEHNNEIWDLAFDAQENEFHVWLNGSKKMQIWNTGDTSFNSVQSSANATWVCDYPTGEISHNAFGEWGAPQPNGNVISKGYVYVVDRGVNHSEINIGFKKIKIEGLVNGVYKIRFSKLNGEDEHVVEIPKNSQYNRIYLSFNNNGSIVDAEPPKSQYDLIFTRYTHIFFEENNLFYLVTGALSNPSGVLVAQDSLMKFNDITLNDVQNMSFSNHADAIGYDWKSFDIDNTKYELIPNRNYIIKDLEGNYYKLRFVDFFNEQGERGYPKFEYQML